MEKKMNKIIALAICIMIGIPAVASAEKTTPYWAGLSSSCRVKSLLSACGTAGNPASSNTGIQAFMNDTCECKSVVFLSDSPKTPQYVFNTEEAVRRAEAIFLTALTAGKRVTAMVQSIDENKNCYANMVVIYSE